MSACTLCPFTTSMHGSVLQMQMLLGYTGLNLPRPVASMALKRARATARPHSGVDGSQPSTRAWEKGGRVQVSLGVPMP